MAADVTNNMAGKYDLLALLTASIGGMPDHSGGEEDMLANICIEKSSFPLEDALGAGGSFTVVAVPPDLLRKCVDSRRRRSDSLFLLRRNKYIIRSPKKGHNLRSMVTELAILRHASIRAHPHVVGLLGLAWEVSNEASARVTPVFVLEHAALGDLNTFLRDHLPGTLAEQLALAVDVTQGLRALHDARVAHGDVKPANVLLFPGRAGKPVAKLADFSSSVLLSEIPDGRTHPSVPGTELWQSPWAARPCTAAQLVRSDVYSLGLVLTVLITRIRPDIFEVLEQDGLDGRRLGLLKANGELADIVPDFTVTAENKTPGGETEATMQLKRFTLCYALSTEGPLAECASGALDVLKMLWLLLHLVIARKLRKEPQVFASLTGLEKAVIESPTMQPASDMDEIIENIINTEKSEIWDVTDNATAALPQAGEKMTSESSSNTAIQVSHSDTSKALPDQAQTRESSASKSVDGLMAHTCHSSEAKPLAYPSPPGEPVVRTYGHDAVISHIASFKKLRNLPSRVFSAVLQELEAVASDEASHREDRRAAAGYEFAAFSIGKHQFGLPSRVEDIQKAADLLVQAALRGYPLAQASVGTVLEGLGLRSAGISPDTEIAWLQHLVAGEQGDAQGLAERRLRKLDASNYAEAIRMRQARYGAQWSSFGMRLLADSGADLLEVFGELEPGTLDHWMFCQYCVVHSENDILRRVLPSLGLQIDARVTNGRTLLLEACYASNAEAATMLVLAGAVVTVPLEADGTTALHLLFMFPDNKIDDIAATLKNAGADIEARRRLPPESPGCIDLQDAIRHATPLLSAVAAGSITAVRALIGLGADPFDEMKTMSEGERAHLIAHGGRCYGPLHYAARLHMSEMLQVLLPDDRRYEQLNCVIRYDEPSFWVLPIWCALDYSAIGLWQRLCLHGQEHARQCTDTVEFLYRRGTRNSKTCGHQTEHSSRHSFDASCHLGQPFLMRRLWSLANGQLQPSVQDVAKIIQRAIDFDDCPTVHQLVPLMEQSFRKMPAHDGFKFLASIQGHKPPEVIGYFIELDRTLKSTSGSRMSVELFRDQPGSLLIGRDEDGPAAVPRSGGGIKMSFSIQPGADGVEHWNFESAQPVGVTKGEILPPDPDTGEKASLFESAILGGYFDHARDLFETQNCDLLCRRREEGRGHSTLLGRLIRDSKRYEVKVAQARYLLSLVPQGSDELFWDVLEDDNGSKLTALHAAVIHVESPQAQQARFVMPILEAVLDRWSGSVHLERLTTKGQSGTSALHLAVETGNLRALRYIGREAEGPVQWNILNGLGETPLDIALQRSLDVEDVLSEAGVTPEDPQWNAKVNNHFAVFEQIRRLLKDNGAKHSKIGGFVFRESEDSWTIRYLNRLGMLTTPADLYETMHGNGRDVHRSADGELLKTIQGPEAAAVLEERAPSWARLKVGDHLFLSALAEVVLDPPNDVQD